MASRRSNPSVPPVEAEPDPASMTYEQAIEALEAIIRRHDEGSIGLEESIAAYRRGTALIRRCRELLDRAEQEIRVIEKSEGGSDES